MKSSRHSASSCSLPSSMKSVQLSPCIQSGGFTPASDSSVGATSMLSTMCSSSTWPVLIRSEEHTSELQSLMRISYAVFCLKKKTNKTTHHHHKSINNTNNSNKSTILRQ